MNDYAFSVDLGGTTANFSVFNSDEIISTWTVATPQDNVLDMIESEITGRIKELQLKSSDVKAIVIGVPGTVKEGVVQECINLNLPKTDISLIFESKLNIKTIVLNDVNLLALGEAQNYSSLFLVTLGTGIGSGLIVNGQIVEGFNGVAGEIGHIYLDSKTPEENASARGLVKTMKKYLESNNIESSLNDFDDFTAEDMFNQAELGDEVALNIINEIYFKFGKLLAVICSAFDPEVVIISGGVSNAGDLLLNPIKDGFNEVAFKETEIRISQLKEKAAICGAMKIIDF